MQMPARTHPTADGQAARGLAAELFVVIVAQRHGCAERACTPRELREGRAVAARDADIAHVARDPIAQPIDTEHELVATELQVVLPGGAVAARVEGAGEVSTATEAGRLVPGPADLQRRAPRRPRARDPASARDLVHEIGFVEERAVEGDPGVAALQKGLELAAARGAQPGAQVRAGVAVRIAVRLRREAAAAGRERQPEAGVRPIGTQVRGLQIDPATGVAEPDRRGGLRGAVRTAGEACCRCAARATPREDLDDAAHGIGAVQARARTAHDLDALDGVERQVLDDRDAGGDRADAHPVDQPEHVVRLAAAQVQRGRLPDAALPRQRDALHPCEQFVQRTGLCALDVGALDDGHR